MIQANGQKKIQERYIFSATKVVATSIGVIGGGLAGIVHGFFAMLQGNVTPSSIVINPIGPAQRLWPEAALHAISIVPNFFITGICAMIVGLLIVIWAGVFIDKKYGTLVLLLLSIILLLVGGGFGSAFLGIIASLTATQINKPLSWWRTHLPNGLQNILVKLWPWALITYLLFFLSSVGIAISGIPLLWFFNADITYGILLNLGPISDVILLFAILTAFAYDIQRKTDFIQAPSTRGGFGQ
jgi:hypothetical protein